MSSYTKPIATQKKDTEVYGQNKFKVKSSQKTYGHSHTKPIATHEKPPKFMD